MGILSSQFLDEGDELFSRHEYDRAMECYIKAKEENDKNPRVYNNMANVYTKKKDFENALKAYEKVLELDRTYPGANNGKGFCLNSLKRYEDSIQVFKQSLSENPSDCAALCGQAYAHQMISEFDEAQRLYQKVLKLPATETRNVHDAARAGLEQLAKAKGVQSLIEENTTTPATDLGTDSGNSLFNLFDGISGTSNAHHNSGIPAYSWLPAASRDLLKTPEDHQGALDALKKQLEETPNNEELWFKSAKSLQFLGKTGHAIECYDRALGMNTQVPAFYVGLGIALFEAKRHAEAAKTFEIGLQLAAAHPLLLSNYAAVSLKLNRKEKAVETFRAAYKSLEEHQQPLLTVKEKKMFKGIVYTSIDYLTVKGKDDDERTQANLIADLVMELNFLLSGRPTQLNDESLQKFKLKHCCN